MTEYRSPDARFRTSLLEEKEGPAINPTDNRTMGEERELSILNAVAEALNSSPDVRQALEKTLGLVAAMLGLRTGWVWLLDAESRPYLAASLKLPPFLQRPAQMEGWLCPALFKYFDTAPKEIYVKAEPKA